MVSAGGGAAKPVCAVCSPGSGKAIEHHIVVRLGNVTAGKWTKPHTQNVLTRDVHPTHMSS